jgi:hypothetical protein
MVTPPLGLPKPVTLFIVPEEVFAAVAPIHQVINCPRLLDSRFARQGQRAAPNRLVSQEF